MFYGSFGTYNSMMALIFISDPRSGQGLVEKDQISEFIFFSFRNIPILSSVVSGFKKCPLFWRTTMRNAKKCVSKSDVVTFTWLQGHWTAKINILTWNFVHCCLYIALYYESRFECLWKFLFCKNLLLEKKWKLVFWGSNPKSLKIWDSHLVERFFFAICRRFFVRFTSKPYF